MYFRNFSLLCIVVCLLSASNAYRIGDIVDTIMWSDAPSEDFTRSSMPRFGIPTTVQYPEMRRRFSLGFEEGLFAIPWIDVKTTRGEVLDKLVVNFIYSKSGDGTIHSIYSETTYKNVGELGG